MTGQSFDWICFWGDYPSTTRENHCYTAAKHTPDAQPQGLLDGRKHGLIIVGLDAAGKTTWLYSGFFSLPNQLPLPPSLSPLGHTFPLTHGCKRCSTAVRHCHLLAACTQIRWPSMLTIGHSREGTGHAHTARARCAYRSHAAERQPLIQLDMMDGRAYRLLVGALALWGKAGSI